MAEPTPAPTAPDVRLLRSITLRNILSFGPDTPPLELRALNVLIGPNGSGKSNLLDAVELLKKAPDAEDLVAKVNADNWIHKGDTQGKSASIEIEALFGFIADVLHQVEFVEFSRKQLLIKENIEVTDSLDGPHEPIIEFKTGNPFGTVVRRGGDMEKVSSNDYNFSASCLFQFRGAGYLILTSLANQYRQIRLYREWTFGRNSGPRLPRPTDERNDFLAEDGSNLGLVMSKLGNYPEIKDQFISALNELYEGIKDFHVQVEGGSVQIFLREGNSMIPATRLSDGTLRYLCLLAILLHPTPPPLICLEEPELGLHPDAVVAVGKLIKEASTRTQLIITTHSRILIDTFQESPDDVVVVSKEDGCTQFNRLDADQLRPYLDKYSLSNLWSSGDIGGNRWS